MTSDSGTTTAQGTAADDEARTSSSVPTPDVGAIKQLLTSAAQPDDSLDITQLVSQLLSEEQRDKEGHRQAFLAAAPSLLSLNAELENSLESLDSLAEFLTTFSSDLASASRQIASLKQRSAEIDEQLRRKRAAEEPIARLLARGAVLDPRIVARIFDSDVDQSWKDVVKQLERSIEATRRPLDQIVGTSKHPSRAKGGLSRQALSRRESAVGEFEDHTDATESLGSAGAQQCLDEARRIAEACKLTAALKIRSHLVAPFELLRKSVTTNLQVLQTSVLIPHHQPLYAFLARQMPRIAIDVQRSYVSAARLFFETGFRRYARSLGQIQKRGYQKGQGVGSILNVPSTSSGAFGGIFGSAGSANSGGSDPFLTDPARLAHSCLSDDENAPPVILGYMSDSPNYTAPPEALFRSLSLVFFDNACSEFTFLVRYFDSLPVTNPSHLNKSKAAPGLLRRTSSTTATSQGPRSRSGSASIVTADSVVAGSAGPATPVSETWARDEDTTIGDETVADETMTAASLAGEADSPPPSETAASAMVGGGGNLVQLSVAEREHLRGRGASVELFRKVMDPVLGSWLNFARAILYGTPFSSAAGPSNNAAAGSTTGNAKASTSGFTSLTSFVGAGPGSASSASTPLPLMPLLIMIRLVDQLLQLAEQRGADSVLTTPLLQFKMEAWPLAQRKFSDEIDAITRLAGTNSNKASTTSGSASWWGALSGGGNAGATEKAQQDALKALAEDDLLLVASRYAALFIQVARLTSPSQRGVSGSRTNAAPTQVPSDRLQTLPEEGIAEDPSSTMLSSSLLRLRSAVVGLVEAKAKQVSGGASGAPQLALITKAVARVRTELDRGTASAAADPAGALAAAHSTILANKTMREVSWWSEWQRERATPRS
ncbi:unnamed protein product [Parajaminaea phylloscopi]